MSRILQVGQIGLGRIGRNHARHLAGRVHGVRLVAAASPVESECAWARETLGLECLYPTLEALLQNSQVDAVWLATPTTLHARQIELALDAGKHVFCEKPLALTLPECDRVLAAAARHPDRTVMIGFMRRYDPAYLEARRRVERGDLGKLFRVHCASLDAIDRSGFFVQFAPTSGGLFLDCSIHDIDIALWMLGDAQAVSVSAMGIRAMYPALASCGDVDTACATVRFSGDVLATFHVSRTSHHGNETALQLIGTEASLSLGIDGTPSSPVTLQKNETRQCAMTMDFIERFQPAFLAEAEDFVRAVHAGDTLRARLQEARASIRLGLAMRDALEQNCVISLEDSANHAETLARREAK